MMKQSTKNRLYAGLKITLFLTIAMTLLSSMFYGQYIADQILHEKEVQSLKTEYHLLDSSYHDNINSLNGALAVKAETKGLSVEVQKTQGLLDDIKLNAATAKDTISLRLDKEEADYDWALTTNRLWAIELSDSINVQLRNELLYLLDKRYKSIWNNRLLVLSNSSTALEKVMTEKENLTEKVHQLRIKLIRAEKKAKSVPSGNSQSASLKRKIDQLNKKASSDQKLNEALSKTSNLRIQIEEIENTILFLQAQNKLSCIGCKKRKAALVEKIKELRSSARRLSREKRSLERKIKRQQLFNKP